MGKRTSKVETVPPLDESMVDDYPETPTIETRSATEAGVDEEAQLRADIEKTRAGMSDTIDALQEKLAPERIMEQVKEKVQEQAAEAIGAAKHAVREATIGKAEHFMDNVSESVNDVSRRVGVVVQDSPVLRMVRDNPLPFALIGAGLGMLAMNRRSGRTDNRSYDREYRGNDRDYRGDYRGGYRAAYGESREGYGDNRGGYRGSGQSYDRSQENRSGYLDTAKEAVSNVADRTKDVVGSATESIKETAGNVADRTREQVHHFSEQAEQGYRHAGDTFENILRDYPLAVGVAALAAGAAFGLAMPGTRVEREYMGEAREQFVDKAQSVAKATVDKVQRVAQEAGRTVQEEAQHQGLVNGD